MQKTTDVRRLLQGVLTLEWARTRLVSDDPAKGLNGAPPETLVTRQLREILGDPTRELDLVSPYFVPAEAGTRYFTQPAERGVAVRVLTNSLEATDIALVHSGYARRRVELLSGGVELFELMRFPDTTAAGHHGADSAGSGDRACTQRRLRWMPSACSSDRSISINDQQT
jgi:cardiolipin synthase C